MVLLLATVMGIGGALGHLLRPANCLEFMWNSSRYERVVVRGKKLLGEQSKGGELLRLEFWDEDAGPKNHYGEANVCACRTEEEQVVLSLVSVDRGHAGRFGYVYAGEEANRSELSALLDACGCMEWESLSRVKPHWWSAVSHLE